MKKVVVFLLSVLLVANAYSLARRSVEKMDRPPHHQQEEKSKIKKEELPEAARKTLEGDAFKGWAIANAYKLKNGEYEVELKKGTNTQSVKFDKDGKTK